MNRHFRTIEEFRNHLLFEGLSKNTVDSYEKIIKLFFKEAKIERAEEITKRAIERWIIRVRRRASEDYAINCLWAIRRFTKFLKEEKKIKVYAMEDLRIPKRKRKNYVEFLDNEEVNRILSLINIDDIHGLRLRTYLEVLLNTGMRPSEALSLRRQDVESLPDEIEIIGKGGKRRKVYFNQRAKYWIKRYLEKREDDHPALFVTHCKPNWWSLRRAEEAFKKLVDRAGFYNRKITLHTLRHTFGTNLLAHGCPELYISTLMGHSDIRVTKMYYLAIVQRDVKNAYLKYLNYEN